MLKTIPTALLSVLLTAQPLLAQTEGTEAETETTVPTTEAPAADPAPQAETAPATGTETAPTDETPAPTPETADAPDAATGTDQAATAEPAAPRPGQPYIRDEFGDWALRCLRAEPGEDDPCQLYQLLMDEEGNAVAEFSTFPLPPGGEAAAGATIVVPLETLLTANLRLSIDNGEPKTYPFTFCNPAGCVARVGFTAAEVNQMKRGASGTLRMVPAAAPDQEVLLTVSLSGFTAGFESVNEQ
ncbi:invasion associated locus B family protein [Salipiger sp. IMCC34102]|uniref:invasion associated locus B family protein n=1 Tax=Salipiger sp. IMCC34102 TaxID=2510647 RepID=UPI00101DEF1E|nr:invasion associated locus B family protein [Salipiger sp. IMCC34102]RYH03441.1 invasion associated locus B family protein [Salipiger sp. IMCC34102]